MLKSLILLTLVAYSLHIEHCLIEEKVCEQCKTGYNFKEYIPNYLYYVPHKYCDNNPIAFCLHMSGQKCISCQSGYELNNDQTQCIEKLPTIELCVSESTSGSDIICEMCKGGYVPSADKRSCVENTNCISAYPNNPSICFKCLNYYYPNSKGKCELSYCLNKNGNGKCETCYPQFYLNEKDECVKIPFEYCKEGDDEECLECLDGFTLTSEGEKKICKRDVEDHCKTKTGDTCSVCEYGYSLNANNQCVDNCDRYATSNICKICENNYIKTNNGASCEMIKSESNSKYISFSSIIYLVLLFIL